MVTKMTCIACVFMVLAFCNMVAYKKSPEVRAFISMCGWRIVIVLEAVILLYFLVLFTVMFG